MRHALGRARTVLASSLATLLILPMALPACGLPAAVGSQIGPRDASTVSAAFPPPPGAERIDGGAFGAWLLALRVHDLGVPVRTFAGEIVDHRARVVDLPMVSGDLQQCADSAIRLRAEWLRGRGDEVSFHATSGDPIPWSRWQRGERPYERGGRLAWRRAAAGTWDQYLSAVFTWAGTRSLLRDTVPVADPRPGDMLLVPGSPGHVVVLLDVARRGATTFVLLGEGYMPAQNFHVEIGPEAGWWLLGDEIDLGHVRMPRSGLRRWRGPA